MSELRLLIEAAIKQRGWEIVDLARAAKMNPSSLYKVINTPTQIPNLKTLNIIAKAADIPLGKLIEACGFPLEPVPEGDEWKVQIEAMISVAPELRDLLGSYVSLNDENRAAVMAIVQAFVREVKAREVRTS